MERLIGLVGSATVGAIMWPFRKFLRSGDADLVLPAPRPARPRAATRQTATASHAADMDNASPVPATAAAVESRFLPVRQEVAECRKAARRLSKAAEKALATGHLDPGLIAETEAALAHVAATIESAETIMNQLTFDDPSAELRWWTFIEQIHEVEADIEVAMSDFCIVHADAHVFR